MPERWVSTVLGHPRAIILVWLSVLLVAIGVLASGIGDITESGYSVPGSESARVEGLLRRYIPGHQGTTLLAVLAANHPNLTAPSSTIASYFAGPIDRLRGLPGVVAAEQVDAGFEAAAAPPGPLVAIVSIRFRLPDASVYSRVPKVEDVLRETAGPGESFGLVGSVVVARRYSTIAHQDLARVETLALPITFVVLCIAFLSLVAAALPIGLAAITLLTTLAVVHAISLKVGLSVFVINTASAVALGLNIDYALIVVTRFREERQGGSDVSQAVARTMHTAGRSVALSGLAVAASLSAMMAVGIELFSSIAIGGVCASLIAVLVATTLLPAVLCVLGERLDRFTVRWAADAALRGRVWRRLARDVTCHPITAAVASLAVLITLATPVSSLRLGISPVSELPSNDRVIAELKRVTAVFGQGATGLMEIVTTNPGRVTATVLRDPGVLGSHGTVTGTDGWYLEYVDLKAPPDSNEAHHVVIQLRRELHNDHGTTVIGGITASEIDILDRVMSRMPVVILLATLVGFAALVIGLKSIVVPLKAVLTSVLSVAAALGIVLRWLPSAADSQGISFFVPLVMFAIVFGLSIDYEVFLLSRVQEAIRLGHSTKDAVAVGLIRSGRPITLAALTVATVFVVFWLSGLEAVRELGVGVGVAILLDVTLVRCVLVPACIVLLGRWNWWFPRFRASGSVAVGDSTLDNA
jgi:uncharacterized membrane protein YdfJ with MMPL/SSD domain